MLEPKVRSAILCEFCRLELGGKVTLIGTMAGDIIVPTMPAIFPISAYMEITGIPLGTYKLTFQFETPDGTIELPAELESTAEGLGAIPLPQLTVQASQPGPLVIRIRLNDGPWIDVISRKVILGSIPQG